MEICANYANSLANVGHTVPNYMLSSTYPTGCQLMAPKTVLAASCTQKR